jgi:hypothetical protein
MKKTLWRGLYISALALLFAIPATAGELKLTINSGRVTVMATDVPVGQLLQEWARVGHVRILNGERLAGPPLTLQLVNVSEKEALDIILRSASGYVAAPRSQVVADASMYDRILIMPTSIAPAAQPAAVAAAPQSFRPPMPTPVDDDDEPVNVPPAQLQPPPQTAPFGQAAPTQQAPATPNQAGPGPFLSSTPGVVVGAPANGQPGQPNPYQPAVVKPGGGGGGGEGAGQA